MKKEVQDMLNNQKRWQASRKNSTWEDKLRDSLRLRALAIQLRKS